jgi:hypothetical protein
MVVGRIKNLKIAGCMNKKKNVDDTNEKENVFANGCTKIKI